LLSALKLKNVTVPEHDEFQKLTKKEAK
jgi:hypothetical protein